MFDSSAFIHWSHFSKHVSFNLLHNNNNLIIRCDKEDIEVTSAFLLQSFSLKYQWMFKTEEN